MIETVKESSEYVIASFQADEPDCVAQLVLNNLCPALYAVLSDGLKPTIQTAFGDIHNSVWHVVETSAQQGKIYFFSISHSFKYKRRKIFSLFSFLLIHRYPVSYTEIYLQYIVLLRLWTYFVPTLNSFNHKLLNYIFISNRCNFLFSLPGPITKGLNELVLKLNSEDVLTEGLIKFNAFIFGLLK